MEPNPNGGRPPPMTGADCDLSGLPWMPLFGSKLLSSDFNAMASDSEFRAAINLWIAAFQQKPAASLPNNDRVLAKLAGLGRDLKAWAKVRAMALYGFVECSDGRLYHTFLSDEAKKSWTHRQRERERKSEYRHRSAKQVSENTIMGMAMSRGPGAGQDADGDWNLQGDSDTTATATTPGQKKEAEDGATPLSSGDDVAGPRPDNLLTPIVTHLKKSDDADAAVSAWNEMASKSGLPLVAKLTDQRRRALRARLQDCGGIDGWKTAMQMVGKSEQLQGRWSTSGWRADLDFVTRESTFTKLMEGSYAQGEPAKPKDPMKALREHLGVGQPNPGDDDFPFPTINAKASQ